MRYIKVTLSTNYVGEENDKILGVADGVTDNTINEYCDELAFDNADSFGSIDRYREEMEESDIEFEDSDAYSFSIEELGDKTLEEIEEEYGEVDEIIR